MKKLVSLSILLVTALVFTGCAGEEEAIFDKPAAERLNEASDLYSGRLMASPNGWAMQLYPTYANEAPFGKGYLVLCDFNDDHTVKTAMNNELSSNNYLEDTSLWEVIADNGPVLTFNSFNKVMHIFTNPEDVGQTEDEDETGEGIGGDYEFIITDAPADASYIMLKGKKRGTYNLLTPMEDGVDFEEYLKDVKAFQAKMFPSNAPTFNVMNKNGEMYKMAGADDQIPNIYPYDGDEIIDESFNPFLITKWNGVYHLRFRDDIAVGGDDGSTVQDFRYDESKDMFIAVENENCTIEGDNPLRFFTQTLENMNTSTRFQWQASSLMSDAYKTKYDALVADLASKSLTLSNLTLRKSGDDYILRVTYRNKNRNTTVDYKYSISSESDGITMTYQGPVTAAGQNTYDQLPALQDMIATLNQKFTISAGETAFNLRTIKLTSAADPSIWFVVTLY